MIVYYFLQACNWSDQHNNHSFITGVVYSICRNRKTNTDQRFCMNEHRDEIQFTREGSVAGITKYTLSHCRPSLEKNNCPSGHL